MCVFCRCSGCTGLWRYTPPPTPVSYVLLHLSLTPLSQNKLAFANLGPRVGRGPRPVLDVLADPERSAAAPPKQDSCQLTHLTTPPSIS